MPKRRKRVDKAPQLARLRKALALEARRFTEEEKNLINQLSPEEIEMLIPLRKKWGRAFRGKWPIPFFPV
jgi:hypothetical protein